MSGRGQLRRLTQSLCAAVLLAGTAYLGGCSRQSGTTLERIPAAELPEDALPVDRSFGEGLRLVAIQSPKRVRVGETVPITLYWQVERTLTRDGMVELVLEVQTADGDMISRWPEARLRAYPGAGRWPPKLLTPGPDLYVDRQVLKINRSGEGVNGLPKMESFGADLVIQIFDPQKREYWPRADNPKRTSYSIDMILDPAQRAGPPGKPIARFANGLALHWPDGEPAPSGQRFLQRSPQELRAWAYSVVGGETSRVSWWVEKRQREALEVFTLLLDVNGTPLATHEGSLQTNNRYPARRWLAGDRLLVDLIWSVWSLPEESYRVGARLSLVVGLKRSSDGSRIPAFGPDGERLKDDAVVLHEIEVVGEPGPTGEPSSGNPSANPTDDPASDPAGNPTLAPSSDLSSEPTPTPASENPQP